MNKSYEKEEYFLAMFRPRKWMIILLLVCCIINILFKYNGYYQIHGDDYAKLEKIQAEKSEEYEQLFNEKIAEYDEEDIRFLLMHIWHSSRDQFISHEKGIDIFLWNIAWYDAFLMDIKGETKICDPPVTRNAVKNYFLRKVYDETEYIAIASKDNKKTNNYYYHRLVIRIYRIIEIIRSISKIISLAIFVYIVIYSLKKWKYQNCILRS